LKETAATRRKLQQPEVKRNDWKEPAASCEEVRANDSEASSLPDGKKTNKANNENRLKFGRKQKRLNTNDKRKEARAEESLEFFSPIFASLKVDKFRETFISNGLSA